jgi:hypothetical protein
MSDARQSDIAQLLPKLLPGQILSPFVSNDLCVAAAVLISKWVYFDPSREAGVTAALVPSKHAVGVRIPCLALILTRSRLPPHEGAVAMAVRAHHVTLGDPCKRVSSDFN